MGFYFAKDKKHSLLLKVSCTSGMQVRVLNLKL